MKKLSLKSNLIWNSIGSFTYLFCQWFLTWLVIKLSNNLSDAGNLSLAISITNIFYSLACFNVRPFLVSDNTNEYSVDNYTSFRILTSVLSLVLCIVYISFFKYSLTQFICIILYMVFKLGEAAVDLFHSFEQRKSRMDIGGISLFCRGILSVISFSLGFILFKNMNVSILLMIISTGLFIIIYDYPKVKKFEKLKITFDKKKIINIFIKFLPLAVGSFIGILCTSLPRQLLEKAEGAKILGIFATVATPAVIVQVAASYIYNPMIVTFSEYKKNGDKKNFINLFLKALIVIIILSIACYFGSIILSKPVLKTLYNEKIASYAYLFPWVIIYTSINGIMWFCYNILIIFRRINDILIINIVSLIICLLTSEMFIDNYSMNGVNYSLILFTIVSVIIMLICIYKEIKQLKKVS